MKKLLVILLVFALLLPGVYAVQTVNNPNGSVVTIEEDTHDDLFVSDEKVIINGNVNGDLFATGGEVIVNGNVTGDAYIAGGNITVNGQIAGELITAGGQATISGNTEKIIAFCGDLEIKGSTGKIVAMAGNVKIHSTSVVNRYAYIIAGTFDNHGTINGELSLTAEQLVSKGNVGSFNYQKSTASEDISKGIKAFFGIVSFLVTIGTLVLGLLFIKLFPKLFFTLEKEVEKDAIVKAIVGFFLIILTVIVLVVFAVTMIGLPIALALGMFFVLALMASGLIVSYCTGDFVTKRLNFKTGELGIFIIGFAIIAILKLIPILGMIVGLVVVSLGFGLIFYAVKNNWKVITARN
jgi:cytoskeletal protein CcmA (bactofilin family)